MDAKSKKLYDAIMAGFGLAVDSIVSDTDIEENYDLMWIKDEFDYLVYVPSYMLWCLKNKEEASLVFDFTLQALAEYGRTKQKDNNYLNFKFLCNEKQKKLVIEFLEWFQTHQLYQDNPQLQRALKQWRKP